MSKIDQVVEILINAKKLISEILTDPEMSHHAIKLDTDLTRAINYFSLLTGGGDVLTTAKVDLGEAKTIAGKPIHFSAKKNVFDTTPEEDAVNALKAKADRAYTGFLQEDSITIRKEYDDMTIRAVAKKAGMKEVTMVNPAVIDVRFIDSVKSAMIAAEQFKQEQTEDLKNRITKAVESSQNFSIGMPEPGLPTLDRQDEVESAFDDENKATSEDFGSVDDIEAAKEEKSAMSEQIKSDQAKGLTAKAKGKK